MKKILSIIVIILLICCSFGVQGVFFKQTCTKATKTPPSFSPRFDRRSYVCGCNNVIIKNDAIETKNKLPSYINISNENFPDHFNWGDYEGQDWTTPARQQLMGDCGVFSAIGALESIINIRENKSNLNLDLSEQYILSCLPAAAIEYGKGCTYGALPSNAYQYIMSTSQEGNNHNGVTWESCFPYQASDYSQGITIDQITNDWLEFLSRTNEDKIHQLNHIVLFNLQFFTSSDL